MGTQHLTSTDAALTVRVERSIMRINPGLWDSIGDSVGLYRSHRFLRCMEESGVEDAEYWYVLFFREDRLIATAVLTRFVTSLDLMLPNFVQRLSRTVRMLYPSFLRVPMLFCGLPISIGKHTLSLSEPAEAKEIVSELDQVMMRIARENNVRYLCFKEFAGPDVAHVQSLERLGYLKAHSIPRVTLRLDWDSFAEYVKAMRHHYRRAVRLSLVKLGIHDPASFRVGSEDKGSDSLRLSIRPFDSKTCERMHTLYLEVMHRTTVKLEILNRTFFGRLAENMSDDLVLLALEDTGGLQGVALLGRNGKTLNFLLVGMQYPTRDRYHTYFNLLNAIIAYGLQEKFETIDLGQTTYIVKQRLGGTAEPVYFFLRALSPAVHGILRRVSPVLFPPTKLLSPRVFHQSPEQPT